MKIDQIFALGWIGSILQRLPPQLALQTEALAKEHGFDAILIGLLQSSDAQKHLQKALAGANSYVRCNANRLGKDRVEIMARVQIGARTKPAQ